MDFPFYFFSYILRDVVYAISQVKLKVKFQPFKFFI